MGSQQFCLRWNNHQTNMLNVFDQLLQSEDFVDVTLACEGLSIKAHKVVLSACSPYFQSLFKENPCKHPIVILKDMKYVELRSIVDFMYKGEINVSQDQLSTLLKTAETLKVKGLAEVSSGAVVPPPPPPPVHSRGSSNHGSGSGENGGGEEGGGGGTSNSFADEMTAASQRPNAGSPQSDGRMSPHSRRKRHRPARRLSNDDPAIDSSEICFEVVRETDPKITPKTEPVELLAEPPIELLMDTNPSYDIDTSPDARARTHDSHDTLSGLTSDGLAQPSTSGTQPCGQDQEMSRSKRWKHSDMRMAIDAVRGGLGIKSASKKFNIPTMTLWRWTQKCGVTSVYSPYGGRKQHADRVGSASAALVVAAATARRTPATSTRRLAGARGAARNTQYTQSYNDEEKLSDFHLQTLLNPYAHSDVAHPSSGGSSYATNPWARMPCRSGPCKTWQEDTMFAAVRAVLKLGMPLINVSRRFGIPYPTLFYYTNRVRQLLKPCDPEGLGRPTFGYSRPPGKRGRPTKVYLGTWRDEDLTKAILRVVYKDYIPESIDALLGASSSRAEIEQQWPSSSTVGNLFADTASEMEAEDQEVEDEHTASNLPPECVLQEVSGGGGADGAAISSVTVCPTSSTVTVTPVVDKADKNILNPDNE